ncbi:unnamed protein product [Owenia fusiformis]|uniref:Uncharacterized protein n=2 Tax=Owenia fusiformis TaxID=6347 RepID=A0A8J1TLV3_OWEFU|nr:unnamed protein product [Owenia fusiformis]
MSETRQLQADQYKGWLYKWTNYIKGYQKRWFVLQNGLLSYYRNQAEMAHTCRGTINLANAFIHTEDSCTFVISNAGTQSFHLKASSEVERQRWVTALELAKTKAISLIESDDDEDEIVHVQHDKDEFESTVRTLSSKIEDLSTCNDLITKHGAALQKSLGEVEQMDNSQDASAKINRVNERATLFRITTNAMINACTEYLDIAQSQGKRWQKMLQHEHEQRLRLEEMVEQLAKQHSSFEKQVRKSFPAVNLPKVDGSKYGIGIAMSDDDEDEEDDEFFDTVAEPTEEFKVALPHAHHDKRTHRRTGSGISTGSIDSLGHNYGREEVESSDTDSEKTEEARVISRSQLKKSKSKVNTTLVNSHKKITSSQDLAKSNSNASIRSGVLATGKKQRRDRIPEKPNYSINLWSIMKNCIGKDLTKIPLPVNFCEPLSMLQRLTEEFEYSDILDKAAKFDDATEQLMHVAAFTISVYSTTTNRTGKPFNPLLGETFECDRWDDLGWKSISEQVSHHPPMLAMNTEGREGWTLWQEFTATSKFRGKYLQIVPLGVGHLKFHKSGNHYTWRKVTTTVHNIIVGKLWVDNHGEMDIVNNSTGDTCHLKYNAYSYFSREAPRKVTGVVSDKNNRAKWVLTGQWDSRMEGAKVLNISESNKGKPVFETGAPFMVWQKRMPPPWSDKMYNFTKLAMEINEMEEGIAPTDSRYRPDQRAMERGEWDEANRLKLLLEEKQRAVRRKREAEQAEANEQGVEFPAYEPLWFKQEHCKYTGKHVHTFKNTYWQCKEKGDFTMCPDIYL